MVASLQSLMAQRTHKNYLGIDKGLSITQLNEVQQMLSTFEAIFKEPKGLPPARKISHGIELYKEVGPVSVRPYKYPYHHKEEIEN